MKNHGKIFEIDIKNSIPESCLIVRLNDSSGAWGAEGNTRFTPSNPCDYIVIAPKKVFFLELKSYADLSIPFSGIRTSQLEGLAKIKNNIAKSYFIFNFRRVERTYAVPAQVVKQFIEKAERKSIPIEFCKKYGIEIAGEKKRTRFKYDLGEFLGTI